MHRKRSSETIIELTADEAREAICQYIEREHEKAGYKDAQPIPRNFANRKLTEHTKILHESNGVKVIIHRILATNRYYCVDEENEEAEDEDEGDDDCDRPRDVFDALPDDVADLYRPAGQINTDPDIAHGNYYTVEVGNIVCKFRNAINAHLDMDIKNGKINPWDVNGFIEAYDKDRGLCLNTNYIGATWQKNLEKESRKA